MNPRVEPSGASWRSAGFRLAAYYGFLVIFVMVVIVTIIYMRTAVVFYHRMEHQVAVVGDDMRERFGVGGLPALEQAIHRHLADGVNDNTEIFLLLDTAGRKLAGNLDEPPAEMTGREQRLVSRDGTPIMAYVSSSVLPDGSILYVGSDLHDQNTFESLIAQGIGIAVVVALVLLLGSLFLFRQQLERSIAPLRYALHQVAQGKLKTRVPLSNSQDEFDLLSHDINHMLERIETLMSGIEHVSNTIAHNLRTPLTRILLRMQGWARDGNTSPDQRQRLEQVATEIEDLISVFERLLHIAEAEAGAGRMERRPVNIQAVVREVLDFYEVVAEEHQSQLVCHIPPGTDAPVLGDASLLAQALSNLVDNALKYAGPQAQVSVDMDTTGGFVTIAVRDNGPGVSEQALQQLGQRFFRLQPDLPGHGLGLSAVAAIVTSHGGTLRFEDGTPGLAVRMVLPQYKP